MDTASTIERAAEAAPMGLRWRRRLACTALLAAGIAVLPGTAAEAASPVLLGTAAQNGVLAGQGVTNTGPSVIFGNVATQPAAAVTGFPPGLVNGAIHRADAVALQAKSDLTTAYTDAAGRTGAAVGPQLGGLTLTEGVYNGGALNLTGTLTLNGPGVYIFTASSSLITATGSTVSFINGANPCDVYWQVTSSATLNGPEFVGNVMALTSITVGNGVHVAGRLLARNGNVTLINDVINATACGASVVGGGGVGEAPAPPGTPGPGGGAPGPVAGAPGTARPARLRPTASFVGPCGDPFYAARFNNRLSNRTVRFTFTYTSYPSGRVVKISRRVARGHTFRTKYVHVVGSTVLTIRGPGTRILRQIRAAPPGNYRPC